MFDKETGRTVTAPLKFPRLKEDAIPSLMPNCPSYLSSEIAQRETPESRLERKENSNLLQAIQVSIKETEEYNAQRQISNFQDLLAKLSFITLPNNWHVINKETSILFVNLIEEPVPTIKSSVIVNEQLKATAHIESLFLENLGNKFSLPVHVTNTNIISDIIDTVNKHCSPPNQKQSENHFNLLKNILDAMKPAVEEKQAVLNFLEEQINLIEKKKTVYSSDMLVFSTLFHTISPHAYKFVRSSGNVILPHPSTIQRVCSSYNFSPTDEQSDHFLRYISYNADLLKECDKKVNLLIDEIHVKACLDYKGGNILGVSYNDKNMATSAHVFMISSITSSYKDVVHILPVKTMNYLELHSVIRNTILGLEKLGFHVISVVTDNNSINRKAMTQFVSPPSINILYPHPADKSRPLFYVTDPVHLLKSVRNNWLNQKNAEQCMYFPVFDDVHSSDTFQTASLSAIRKLVTCESNSLLKFGNSIPLKALSPSNLERQNVNLVLKLFNNFVIEALLELGPKYEIPHFTGTAEFIRIILTWWNIINVKSPFKGIRLNNVHMYPLTSTEEDVKYVFLHKFLDWLDKWESMNCSTGMLTKETHNALKNTTYAMTQIVSYCQKELGLHYILPGKFQTDHLENRFSLYRQLAGGQYHVSVRQIFESEKKLRMQTSIKLSMETKSGLLTVTDFNVPTNFDEMSEKQKWSHDYPIVISDDDIAKATEKLPVIVYVGGYCVYSVLKKLDCEECTSNLTIDKESSKDNPAVQFTMNLDRGQLIIPSSNVVNVVMYTYIVVSKLCFEHEDKFLKEKSQKHIATVVTSNILESEEICCNVFCSKGHDATKIDKMVVWSTVNILLNNYCKERNSSEGISSKKRKLQVFSK